MPAMRCGRWFEVVGVRSCAETSKVGTVFAMSLSESERIAISSLEQQFSARDGKFARRFSTLAHRELTRRHTGTTRGRHGWRLGVGLWLVGLAMTLVTLQDEVLLPLCGVLLMYLGIVNVVRWARSTSGAIVLDTFTKRPYR
jgi:hypothetical protein